jgi:hypothetical protein
MATFHRSLAAHEERLVVAYGGVAVDVALHAHRRLRQEWSPRGAQPPVALGELVDQVAGLLAEEPGHVLLVTTEEVHAHTESVFGHAERVIDPRDAHEEIRGVDAALGDEAGQASAHIAVRRTDRHDEVRVVDTIEKGVESGADRRRCAHVPRRPSATAFSGVTPTLHTARLSIPC